jgi:hypothetical protein
MMVGVDGLQTIAVELMLMDQGVGGYALGDCNTSDDAWA